MVQEVRGKSLSGAPGMLLVAGVVAFLWLASRALSRLQRYIGYLAASVLLWVVGMLAALWVLRAFVMGYRYELRGDELILSRLYGRRARFMEQVPLRAAVAWGPPEDVKRRFPEARWARAVKKGCPLEPFAIAVKGDGVRIICLQPDARLREGLLRRLSAR